METIKKTHKLLGLLAFTSCLFFSAASEAYRYHDGYRWHHRGWHHGWHHHHGWGWHHHGWHHRHHWHYRR